MKLSHEDAGLFFHLMWELQFYVNRKLNLLPGIESVDMYSVLDQKDKMAVRQTMYDRFDEWSDMFVAENPYGRPAEELQIVQSWKRRVMGDFYILRFLKNYTVFLAADKSAQVYAVLGLQDSIQDILFHFLPILCKEKDLMAPMLQSLDEIDQERSLGQIIGMRWKGRSNDTNIHLLVVVTSDSDGGQNLSLGFAITITIADH